MKKSLAIVSGLAVAGSLFAAPQASAADVQGIVQCSRDIVLTGGTDNGAQDPTSVKLTIDSPESVTAGEKYAVTATVQIPDVLEKSGLQATRLLELPENSDYKYQLINFNGSVAESNTNFSVTEKPEDSAVKDTVRGRYSLGGNYTIKLTKKTEETDANTEHTLKKINFNFDEMASTDGADFKKVSTWNCSFTADEAVKIKVNPAPATPEDPADNPATPGDENGSSKGAGILNALLGLLAGVGIFHFFVAPLFGGANGSIVAGSSNLFAFLPKEVRDFFGLK